MKLEKEKKVENSNWKRIVILRAKRMKIEN